MQRELAVGNFQGARSGRDVGTSQDAAVELELVVGERELPMGLKLGAGSSRDTTMGSKSKASTELGLAVGNSLDANVESELGAGSPELELAVGNSLDANVESELGAVSPELELAVGNSLRANVGSELGAVPTCASADSCLAIGNIAGARMEGSSMDLEMVLNNSTHANSELDEVDSKSKCVSAKLDGGFGTQDASVKLALGSCSFVIEAPANGGSTMPKIGLVWGPAMVPIV
jgi:hypothetical protein